MPGTTALPMVRGRFQDCLDSPVMINLRRIVVIGGGFAGLSTALAFRHVQPRHRLS